MPQGVPTARALIHLDECLTAGAAARFAAADTERLLELARDASLAIYTRLDTREVRDQLRARGVPSSESLRLLHAPSAERAADQLGWCREGSRAGESRLFLASTRVDDLVWARDARDERGKVVPIFLALASPVFAAPDGTLVGRTLAEASDLVLSPRAEVALSVVLMAFNERESVAAAIRETRLFCRAFVRKYEIVVVDDGSRDDTAGAAREASQGDVRVLVHPLNRGMGAAMRTGYLAAQLDYVVPLPADRQIRAQQLVTFLPQLAAHRCVHGFYRVPHSGAARALMSSAFRLIVRHVGGLAIDFAGAYVFHRHWLQKVDLGRLPSESFVFSFELLDALAQLGCQFSSVELRAFAREVGASRVARPGRIARVFGEVVRSRVKRARDHEAVPQR